MQLSDVSMKCTQYATALRLRRSQQTSSVCGLLSSARCGSRPAIPWIREKQTPPKGALRITKDVFFRGHGFMPTPVFKRTALRSGNRVNGPALIEEHASTTVVHPGDVLTVDGLGNLQIQIGSERK